MGRYNSRTNRTRNSIGKTSLLGVMTLVATLSGILLFITNEKQNEQVLNSYCGDFGFGGKTLVLMKDRSFRFSYYGCSQTNGYVRGTWAQDGIILTLSPETEVESLDIQYQRIKLELVPVSKPSEDKFVLCEEQAESNGTLKL
ncbi:MAG: hypothetical protein ACPGU4_09105 [Flavobacteriales bacterium]